MNKKKSESTKGKAAVRSRKRPMFHVLTGELDMPSRYEFEELEKKEKLRSTRLTLHGRLKKNEPFNLHKDIVPYDQNRVKLQYSGKESDYINSSWIHRPETEEMYDPLIRQPYLPSSQLGIIVSQTPVPMTMNHHLMMIYENDVHIAISLSGANPFSLNTEDNSIVSQTLLSKHAVEHFLTKETWDLNTARGCIKELVYYHIKWNFEKSYSDEDYENMIKTITYIRLEIGTSRPNINMLVHDGNGGISEAAIFMALFYLLEEIDEASLSSGSPNALRIKQEEETLDIFGTVDNLRNGRMKMIRSHDEYNFLHRAVVYYTQNKTEFDDLLNAKDESRVTTKKENTTVRSMPADEIPVQYVLYESNATTDFDSQNETEHANLLRYQNDMRPENNIKQTIPKDEVTVQYVIEETEEHVQSGPYENFPIEGVYQNM